MRENAFAHEGAAQRANHRKRKKSGTSQEIDREKIRKKRAIEDIDAIRAQKNVAPAHVVVGFQCLRGADVSPKRARIF